MKYALAVVPFLMVGCATNGIDKNYEKYLEAQTAMANKPQQPLLRIKAQPGATIQMSGMDEFVVFAPESNQQSAQVQQYVAPRNEGAEVMKAALGVVGTVGSIYAVGNATKGLANAVGSSANHGYQYVQSPQPNQTIGGSGVIGSGTFNTTTSTSTLSGTGVLGNGTSLSGTGSTGGAYTANPTTTTNTNSNNPVTNPVAAP